MKLFYHPSSPYVRKVLVTAIEAGLDARIERVALTLSPVQPHRQLARYNPLMKVPTLLTEAGVPLFDSRVICEYLDSLHQGPKLLPPEREQRWRVLRLQALADGLLDAAVLCRYEATVRPAEKQWAEWVAGQRVKAMQALDAAEAEMDLLAGPLHLGQIALACALGWLEFRAPIGDIRGTRPALLAWYDAFAARPSMAATAPMAPVNQADSPPGTGTIRA